MIRATERYSGVRKLTPGYANFDNVKYTRYRSVDSVGSNVDVMLQALRPVPESQIGHLVEEIEAEGNSFLSVPAVKGKWPER